MKTLLSLWIMGMSLLLTSQEPIEEFNVLPSSTLEIHGSSNVNNFTCVFDMEDISTVSVNYNSRTQKFESALVQFPVASFDCGEIGKHTSELQSRGHLVCRLLLEKKKKYNRTVNDNGIMTSR